MSKLPAIFLTFLIASNAVAGSCQAIGDVLRTFPELSQNAEFWQEIGQMSSTDSAEIRRLAAKYAGTSRGEVTALSDVTATGARRSSTGTSGLSLENKFEFSGAAKSGYKKLEPSLKEKFSELLETLNREDWQSQLRAQPGRWNLERIKEMNGSYSVRLNQGTRVVFDVKDKTAVIKGIGSGVYDH